MVLFSGGADSACLLDLAVRIAGATFVHALHVNYGLRPDAESDEELCRQHCARLGDIPLAVVRPKTRPDGNVQAWARRQRYDAAARIAAPMNAWVATGHTASDQAETVLYRLASAPGRRALLGIKARDGKLVRPLLGLRRADTEAYCRERDLAFAEDPSNRDPRYARNRVRHELLSALRAIHPAAEENVLRTLSVLQDEAVVLDALVTATLAQLGSPVRVERLMAVEPALRRLVLQKLADEAADGHAPAVGPRAGEILALGPRGGTAQLDLGRGLRVDVTYGELKFLRTVAGGGADDASVRLQLAGGGADDLSVRLRVPGSARFGAGTVVCEVGVRVPLADGTVNAAALAKELEVRHWRPGDRMRPLGLSSSKSLQDLFTDRKVPRAQRGRLPIVISGGQIAWIPGVATGDGFRVADEDTPRARLTWEEAQYDPRHGSP